MGVPVFGGLSEALALEEVNGERFELLARWLDSLREAALVRSADRDRRWTGAARQVAASTSAWVGPNGDDVRRRVSDLDGQLVRGGSQGPVLVGQGRDGFESLAALAETARAVGIAIDAVQQDHRNRLQVALGGIDELAQRGWTNVQDLVGAESDADAERTRRAIDAANRARADAEAEVERQLHRWHEACGAAAEVVDRAIAGFSGALAGQAPVGAGPAAAVPDASDPGRRWIEDTAVPFLVAHADDTAALERFWRGLTDDQRRTLMRQAPELVEGHLLDVLRADERSRFLGWRDGDRLRDAVRAAGLDPDRFDPLALRTADPTDPDYRRLLDRLARNLSAARTDPLRAAALYEALGIEGVRNVLGMTELELDAAVEAGDERRRDRAEAIVADAAASFAATTGRGELASLRDALLQPERRWQLHQLALLLSADGRTYDPSFLVRAFDVIDTNSERLSVFSDQRSTAALGSPEQQAEAAAAAYPTGTIERPLYRDLDLLVPALVVRRALAANVEATWQALRGGGDESQQRLERLMHDHSRSVFVSAGVRADLLTQRVRDRLDVLTESGDRYAAVALDRVLRAKASEHHDDALALYRAGVVLVAESDTTVEARRAMAGNLLSFLPDLATGQWLQVPNGRTPEHDRHKAQTTRPGRPEMIQFFAAVAEDQTAMALAGSGLRLWIADVGSHYDPVAGPTDRTWSQRAQEVMMMASLVRKGLIDVGEGQAEAAKALGAGWESASALLLTTTAELVNDVPGVGAALEWVANETASALGESVAERANDAALATQQKAFDFHTQAVTDFEAGIRRRFALDDDAEHPLLLATVEPYGSLMAPSVDSGLDWFSGEVGR